MAVSISAVLLLLVVVFMLVRKGGLKGGHAVVCVLLGFYLASSSLAPTIRDLTTNVADMISEFDL
ncbi:hypothetical protein AB0C40_20970 [Streptomyces brevispora]|uniref:hypothetical protein n=1 Tax=Streptomyces TaxID=1883 RepID=UPI000F55452E|nr:hypothetical protein [Streptomyces sp. ADI92-24]RPK48367.1 hypothetical protein EES39_09445 [Streptomyces sp. ADI92-24]